MNTIAEIVRIKCKVSFVDFLIGYSCALRNYLWIAPIYAFFMTALSFYATSRDEGFSLDLIPRSIYFFFLESISSFILLVPSIVLMISIFYYPRRKVFSSPSEILITDNILTDQSGDKKLEVGIESVKWVKIFYERILVGFDNGIFIIIPPDSRFLVGSKQALLDWLNQERNTSF